MNFQWSRIQSSNRIIRSCNYMFDTIAFSCFHSPSTNKLINFSNRRGPWTRSCGRLDTAIAPLISFQLNLRGFCSCCIAIGTGFPLLTNLIINERKHNDLFTGFLQNKILFNLWSLRIPSKSTWGISVYAMAAGSKCRSQSLNRTRIGKGPTILPPQQGH